MEHLVRRGDGLRRELIGALSENHRDEFVRDVDVRCLESLTEGLAQTVDSRSSGRHATAGLGLAEESRSKPLESGRVRETCEFDLTDWLGGTVAQDCGDGTVTGYPDSDGVRGQLKIACKAIGVWSLWYWIDLA